MRRTLLRATLLALATPAGLLGQTLEDYDYENLEFRGVGVDFGFVSPATVEQAPVIGLRADLGFLGPHVRIMPAISFWASHLEEVEVRRLGEQIRELCLRQDPECPRFDLGQIRRSSLSLHLDGHWVAGPGWPVVPYAGAGVGIHLLNGRGDAIEGTFVEDALSTVTPGLNLLAGLDLPVVPHFVVGVEARTALSTDIRFLTLQLGARWLFHDQRGWER